MPFANPLNQSRSGRIGPREQEEQEQGDLDVAGRGINPVVTLSDGLRFGSYEVAGQIGAGGMGEVFRARDTKLKRDVALKVLPASFATSQT